MERSRAADNDRVRKSRCVVEIAQQGARVSFQITFESRNKTIREKGGYFTSQVQHPLRAGHSPHTVFGMADRVRHSQRDYLGKERIPRSSCYQAVVYN